MNTIIFISLDIAMVSFFALGVHNVINGALFNEKNIIIVGAFDMFSAICYGLILHSLLIQ